MPTEAEITVALADLGVGKMLVRSAAGREILVCRTREGIFAVDNLCSHADARLNEGRLRGCRAICPLHGAAFDVRTGAVLAGPATQGLAAYAVRVDVAQVTITLPEDHPRRFNDHAIE